ncbi:MAG TPA: nitrile hydratase subunit alpha [Streptosporangiaceae bacterium]|nr:nitrile hydratase subunit alpha [Streptosporangiaceae bacterium]
MSLRPEEGAGTLDERVLIAPDEVLESERSSVITGMVVARAWRDPGYRNRLLSSPREVLVAEGLEIPDGMAIRVFADTPAIRHIHLTSLTTEATELVPVFREMLPLPEGSEVRLIQNTEQALCLVIPLAPPEPQTLTDVDVLRRLAPRASAFAAGDVIATVVSDAFMEAAGEAAAAAAAAAAVNTTQTETASATAFSQESAEVMTTTQSEGWTMSIVSTPGVESACESMSMSEASADTSVSTETNVVTLTNTYTTTDVSTTSFESTSNVTTQTTTAETTLTAAEFEAVATTTSAVAEGEAAVVVVAVGAAVLT